MTTECLHKPEVRRGKKCDCADCRMARSKPMNVVMNYCMRCAGRAGIDRNGQLTCAKGNYKCPVLDVWHAVLNQEIEPGRVDAIYVDLVARGHKNPPKRYRRVPGSRPWHPCAIRDHSKQETKRPQVNAGPVLSAEDNKSTAKIERSRRKGKRG